MVMNSAFRASKKTAVIMRRPHRNVGSFTLKEIVPYLAGAHNDNIIYLPGQLGDVLPLDPYPAERSGAL